MDGEVVGINSSKLASTEVEGMGYAIAISDVADSLENMMNAKARDKVDNQWYPWYHRQYSKYGGSTDLWYPAVYLFRR